MTHNRTANAANDQLPTGIGRARVAVPPLYLLAMWLLGGIPATAVAQSDVFGNAEFNPFARLSVAYDTNLFRLEDGQRAPVATTDSEMSDMFFVLGAGFDANNQFTAASDASLHLEVYRSTFNRFDALDFVGADIDGRYGFGIDRIVSGELRYRFQHELIDFVNQNTPLIDYRSRHVADALISRKLSTRWSVGVSGSVSDIGFSERKGRDLQRFGGTLDLVYTSRQRNEVSFVVALEERRGDDTGSLDFSELSIGPEVRWSPTPKANIRASVQYTQRDADDPSLQDYEGEEGRASLRWKLTDKIDITSVLQRQISSLGDLLSNFAIVDSLNIGMDWDRTDKVTVSFGLARENRDFEEEPTRNSRSMVDIRDDRLTFAYASVRWQPRRAFDLSMKMSAGERSSNRQFQDFDYQRYTLTARFVF